MKISGFWLSVPLCLMLFGCAAVGKHSSSVATIDRDTLIAGPPELVAPEPDVDILAIDDNMRAFLAEHIPENAHELQKAGFLLKAFFGDDGINIQYENIQTRTAIETFYSKEGNCLSFTTLFVAMAREAGLEAYYQEVETPPVWDSRGELYIYNRHINILLKYRHHDDQVVDFDMTNFEEGYPRKEVSDDVALAQYHNNMSVHWLLKQDVRQALAHQRLALRLQPDADYMWTNLGAIYSYFGYTDYAESALLTALEYDKRDLVAISNLARLYTASGQVELGQYYAKQAQAFRRRNPFYLFSRAEKFYAEGDYLKARDELRRAVRLQEGEPEFYELLGLVELKTGETERAQKNFELAQEYASEPGEKARYSRKLRILAGTDTK